jgi:predicted TIM-barrel fold metal-dependent hydrolase
MAYTVTMDSKKRTDFPAIFDSHTHLFSPAVIARVSNLRGLAASLRLNIDGANGRTDKFALNREAEAAGIHSCLLLPTAPVDGVRKINDMFLETVEKEKHLFTAGTLHPSAPRMDEELERLSRRGVRALKLCSFSQGIDLEAEETFRLFDQICSHNSSGKPRFFVILDTFYKADFYFGTPKKHVTTPERLSRIVSAFPEIDFVAAHMGGLAAPVQEIEEHLPPRDNLYLETSNASHLLSEGEFVRLLTLHGPERILFGTDWPWFLHISEVPRIQGLLRKAGYSVQDQSKVFSVKIRRLMGI